MLTLNLTHWISHPEELDKDSLYELRTFLARYPYCESLRLLFLKNLYLLHDITFGQELRKAALYVGDRRKLFYLIEGNKHLVETSQNESLATEIVLKEEPGVDRTLSLIDSFLSNMPVEADNMQIDNLHQISDYTSFLQAKESAIDMENEQEKTEAPALRRQELIDTFIVKAENEPMVLRVMDMTPEKYDTEESNSASPVNMSYQEDDDETYFTETLAKIYIKQHRYDKALEIIKKLSLKYPKKNVYFADQIRFLEKLIINAKTK